MFTIMFSHLAKGGCNSFVKSSKKYFGKNEKAIKMRIKSVTSIEKITKAMKMVRINCFELEKTIHHKSQILIFILTHHYGLGGRQ